MNIFARIKAAVKNEKRGFFLMPWQYGREHVRPDDMQSQCRAYTSWVYIAAQKNAIAFSNTPLRLYVAKKSNDQKILVPTKAVTPSQKRDMKKRASLAAWMTKAADVQEVQEHPLVDMLKKVNDFSNGTELLFDTDLYQELTGNAYWYVVRDNFGLPVSIWSLPSQYMHIIPDAKKYIGGYKWIRGGVEVAFAPEEIIHFKLPNPNDMYYGMSPLQAAKDAYNVQSNMSIYQNAVFSNDGRLAGAFETDQVLNDNTFERLKVQIENNFRGAKNAGKMPLLEAGLHYKEYALAPKELDFLNSRRWTQEEIVNSYGQTLALYDKNTTRANSETALYLWMAHTISPRQRIVEQKLNETFVNLYDPNLFVAFDECVPENVEFKLAERKTYIETGFMTINELRAEDGLEPVPWGDEPMNRMPAMDPSAPGDEEEEDEDDPAKSVKKKPLKRARTGGKKDGMPTSRPLSR